MGWVLFATAVGLNFVAAGAAAILHVWRSKARRSGRIAVAATVAGFFPASIMLAALGEQLVFGSGGEGGILLMVVLAVFAVGGAVSLPLAVMVSRKLDGGGEAFREFE